jgi:PKHD-type hydroxylase
LAIKQKITPLPIKREPERSAGIWAFGADYVENWAYWDNIFSPEECAKIIAFGESYILQKAKVKGNNTKIRNSEVSWLYPNEDTRWIFERIGSAIISLNNQFFKFELHGLAEGFQFTKYEGPSGHYGAHIDKTLNGLVRKLSITIQLSDSKDYTGGDLVLHISADPETMIKDQGRLICFPSYVLHEVRPVTKGTRYSLVAWVTGTPFK